MLLLGAGPHGHGNMPASQSKERSSMNCLALDVYCSLFKHITVHTSNYLHEIMIPYTLKQVHILYSYHCINLFMHIM